MTEKRQFLTDPYSAYHNPALPSEDVELTHVERGSDCGEYLRRYWQPVCLSEQLGEVPHRVRLFGEDLVAFRAKNGEVGILDLHCSHRGSSLEFGIVEENGLRCCYHSWLFAPNGQILETPGDPPESNLRHQMCHGAYPAHEYKGLVFVYMGPPEHKPEFPIYDTFEIPGDRLVPYYITYPCNWLQVQENVMDPAHGVFLHTRISFTQFADVWGELPVMNFRKTPTGMIYITSRRWGENVWVRSNDIILGNLAQVGHIWEDGQEVKSYVRAGITRWTIPIDNTTCRIIGWRHFHPDQDPRDIAKEDECGIESVDFYGQGPGEYQERQRMPGDFDAQTSQRPIALHAMEHLTQTDRGVNMLRQMLRREIRTVANGGEPNMSPLRTEGRIPTYVHDTVVPIPVSNDGDDDTLVGQVGEAITDISVKGDHHEVSARDENVRGLIDDYVRANGQRAAE